MLTLPGGVRLFMATEPTDMRKSFDGLCAIVQHRFHRDPFDGDVFVFINRSRNRVKLLHWDRNGFWISMKRLEKGAFDAWRPEGTEAHHAEIDRAQLSLLLEGLDLKSAKFRHRFARSLRMGARDGRSHDTSQPRRAGCAAAP